MSWWIRLRRDHVHAKPHPDRDCTPTPVFTSTPGIPLISVTVATNCRVGPGKVYDRVGALLVGQVAEVVGRNLNGNYWYIRNPNTPTDIAGCGANMPP